jgi:putative transposase
MPRKKRELSSTGVYHWIARGINRKDLFHCPKDYSVFLDLTAFFASEFDIKVYHYCLMTNHIHMLIHAATLEAMIAFSHFLKRKYAYYQSKTHKISGATFERMYRSKPVSEDVYLLECARYIDRNPLRAGCVTSPGEYPYGSYRVYAKGEKSALVTLSPAYLGLASLDKERQRLYAQFVTQPRPQEEFAAPSSIGL